MNKTNDIKYCVTGTCSVTGETVSRYFKTIDASIKFYNKALEETHETNLLKWTAKNWEIVK